MAAQPKSTKVLIIGATAVGVLLAVLYVGVNLSPRVAFQEQLERNRRAAVNATFKCPRGSSEVLERWSWVGFMRICYANGVEHGPWAAWENSTHLRGQYIHGKKEGEWQWFDSGALTRTIGYRAGVEVYDSLGNDTPSR